jgi:hypothetical protein
MEEALTSTFGERMEVSLTSAFGERMEVSLTSAFGGGNGTGRDRAFPAKSSSSGEHCAARGRRTICAARAAVLGAQATLRTGLAA